MRILYQGDSITDGNRYKDESSRWDLNHQIGHSWAYMVTGKLMGAWPRRFECVNRGVSGDTVLKLRERWQKDALELRPDVLILLVGVNDCMHIRAGDMTFEDYRTVYRELIRRVREVSPELGLMLLEPFLLNDDPTAMEIIAKIQKEVRKIAGEENAVFVPLADEFRRRAEEDGRNYWLWDGTHPTEAGHWVIARRVLETGAPLFGVNSAE